MTERSFTSLAAFSRQFKADIRAREKRLNTAVRKAARSTSGAVAKNVPRAFEELADSIHVEDVAPGNSQVVADSPHAAAVENGSRPHMMPLEPLIRWVQLRGLQGLTKTGAITRAQVRWGSAAGRGGFSASSASSARTIAKSLRGSLGREGAVAWRARAEMGPLAARELGDDPATVVIARAIQMAIAKRGTKPQRFMAASVPSAASFLDKFVRAALPDKD